MHAYNQLFLTIASIPGHSVTELIPVIKRCECMRSCYRVPYAVTYSVFVMRRGKMVVEDLVRFLVVVETCPMNACSKKVLQNALSVMQYKSL